MWADVYQATSAVTADFLRLGFCRKSWVDVITSIFSL